VADVAAALSTLGPRVRGAAADLLVLVAGAGGELGAAELSLLGRVFHLLGLDEDDLRRRVKAPPLDVAAVRRRVADSADIAAMLISPGSATSGDD
jgi:hypothetical protein